MAGFANLPASTFNMLAAKLAAECFIVLLTAVVDEFGIDKANEKIKKKLTLAKMLPFTDGAAQAEALERELLD